MWHTKSAEEVIKELKSNWNLGLSKENVDIRRQEFGLNKLKEKPKEKLWVKFFKQFQDFMILILIIASIISAVVSYIEGSHDYFDSIIIIAIVVLNAIMGLIQEAKAEKSLEALKKMSAPVAKVRRNGNIEVIKGEEIVPGDIILLEAGNYVPADCRLLKTCELKIEESSLTGETNGVSKDANVILGEKCSLGDMINTAFGSTIVIEGHGEGIVTEIGMETKVGRIANMIMTNETPQTPIQKKLEEVGKILGWACLGICIFIFFIGLLKQITPLEMFMTSVGLAVAAIPEGLPAIVTIMLSIGVTKMAKKNAIIRRLPAVETLGSSQIICSDKTGTLTQNKMKVRKITGDEKKVLEFATLCTNCEVNKENKINGEATEVSIASAALEKGIQRKELEKNYPRVEEIPFDSKRKLMTTIHQLPNGMFRIITKGAPDILLESCQKYEYNKNIFTLTESEKEKIKKQNIKMAEEALRVLAVAYRDIKEIPTKIEAKGIEKELTFIGLIGMMDPPREGVKEAVATCRRAGIKTVMITGDHIVTAKAIAKELGILKENDMAISGKELNQMDQKSLERNIVKYSVFARVSPEHKVRIVTAFQNMGKVVAMTGDGVNDAPALKKADIGIAMGITGTDVAKNAADMILTDDNFTTIVEAVKQGRNIFANIKKAIHFLIATNIGEIVTILVGLLLGMKTPLLAIQLLWINLVTDSLPAIALGLEPFQKELMNHKPRDIKESVFADGLWGKIISEGMMIGLLTIITFSIGNHFYGIEVARTMAFISLGMIELIHSFNIKSEESIFKIGIFENKYLLGAFLLGMILQIGILWIPSFANIFKLVPLNQVQWIYTLLISCMPVVIIEIQKKVNELRFGKVVYEYNRSNL